MRNVVRVVKTSRLCSAIILSFTIVWLRIILNQTRFIPHKIRVDRANKEWVCARPHTLASNSKMPLTFCGCSTVLTNTSQRFLVDYTKWYVNLKLSTRFPIPSSLRHFVRSHFVFAVVFVRRSRAHSSVYFTHLHAHTAFGLLCDVCGCCACATARMIAKSRARARNSILLSYFFFFFFSLSFSRQTHLETELLRIAQFVGVLLTSLLKFRLWCASFLVLCLLLERQKH